MVRQTDDLRIRQVRALVSPADVVNEIPVTDRAARVVLDTRAAVANALDGSDSRLVVIVGPCSIHDPSAALDYARKLAPLARRYENELIVVMRAYFEKPRTTVGWKGLINDPDIDESYQINKGLRSAPASDARPVRARGPGEMNWNGSGRAQCLPAGRRCGH